MPGAQVAERLSNAINAAQGEVKLGAMGPSSRIEVCPETVMVTSVIPPAKIHDDAVIFTTSLAFPVGSEM
jgi:hypothetical protein